MSRIIWDAEGERFYETGVRQGVLYPKTGSNGAYVAGVAWNGLTAVNERPTGAEANAIYADDIKYLNLISKEEFEATIEAYTYPDEFAVCDGTSEIASGVKIGQQPRKPFGLSYRTAIGNDTAGEEAGYLIHIIYGATAAPSEKSYATMNESPEAITFSWEVKTVPVNVTGGRPTATLTIDSRKTSSAAIGLIEAALYGVDAPEFSTSSTYAVGDYVTYQSKVYVCTTAVSTAGAWSSANWTEVTDPGPHILTPDEVKAIVVANPVSA